MANGPFRETNMHLLSDKWDVTRDVTSYSKKVAKSYTENDASWLEMHKCRIKAEIFRKSSNKGAEMSCEYELIGEDVSCDIIDSSVTFDLLPMTEQSTSVNSCCTKGGWKVVLLYKNSCPKIDVSPTFIVIDRDNNEDLPQDPKQFWPFFQSIEKYKIKTYHGAFCFEVPPQKPELVDEIRNSGKSLRIALYRLWDNIYSENSLDFHYQYHHDECKYCFIRLGDSYNDDMNRNGKRVRRKCNDSPSRPEYEAFVKCGMNENTIQNPRDYTSDRLLIGSKPESQTQQSQAQNSEATISMSIANIGQNQVLGQEISGEMLSFDDNCITGLMLSESEASICIDRLQDRRDSGFDE